MSNRSIRRSALISPFGVGALIVTPDGTALITAGLDHWLEPPPGMERSLFDPEEFKFKEWRLERELEVDFFVMPPDHRSSWRASFGPAQTNTGLMIPFLRFPQWHVCPDSRCGKMEFLGLVQRDIPKCRHCEAAGRRPPRLVQAQFVGVCEDGHIQDFPWREWVHKDANPTCTGELQIGGSAGASLASRYVTCECGANRSLGRITEAYREEHDDDEEEAPTWRTTYVTENLTDGHGPFLCGGLRPWLGELKGNGCERPLHGTLRGATNVYFGIVRSAIYLPRGNQHAPTAVVDLLGKPDIWSTIGLVQDLAGQVKAAALRRKHEYQLEPYSDEQIEAALEIVLGTREDETAGIKEDDPETSFRRAEHLVLRDWLAEPQLKITPAGIADYGPAISERCQRLTLVEKLRETRAFSGFTRIEANDNVSLDQRKSMLWREPPTAPKRWLPAYTVFGEGIYLELDEARLRAWERRKEVKERIQTLAERYEEQRKRRSLRELAITPRFVLVHTLAHLLITELVFDCGYSSASLRERLYVSTSPEAPMAGLLIYTSSGDSEGTLGGLVRMGKPGQLDGVLANALRNARWCSSDPVCMELGASGGQGPDSCNLAACHSCGLLPETSCEHFNRFLDRWVVVGDAQHPELGFLGGLVD